MSLNLRSVVFAPFLSLFFFLFMPMEAFPDEPPAVVSLSLLLLGDSSQYKEQAIGPEGGRVEVGDQGKTGEGVSVQVPPGAISGESVFVIAEITELSSEPPNYNFAFAYDITASHGETFEKDIEICFSYDPTSVTPAEESNLTIYYFDEDQQSWVMLDSIVNSTLNEVCTEVDHLSGFGLGTKNTVGGTEIELVEDWNETDNSPGWWQPNGYITNTSMGITYDTSVEGINGNKEVEIPGEYHKSDYLEVDLMLKKVVDEDGNDDSTMKASALVLGIFGNYKHMTSDTYEGKDGNIYMNARIEKRPAFFDGSTMYRVVCAAGRSNNPDGTDMDEFFWTFLTDDSDDVSYLPSLSPYIKPDTWYTAILKRTGTKLSCEIQHKDTKKTLLKDSVDIENMDIYEVGEGKNLQVRIQEGSGVAVGRFDNLYVEKDSVPTVE